MIERLVSGLYHAFREYGLPGIFLSMFIENMGIPLPTELGYLAAIWMIDRGQHSVAVVLVVLTAGHLCGSTLAYVIGHRGDSWLRRRFTGHSRLAQVHTRLVAWYGRYGPVTVFATRFIGYVRPWSSFVAGFAGFRLAPFVMLTTVGSFLFNVIALYASWGLVFLWRKYVASQLLLAIVVTVCFLGFVIYEIVGGLRRKPEPPAGDET